MKRLTTLALRGKNLLGDIPMQNPPKLPEGPIPQISPPSSPPRPKKQITPEFDRRRKDDAEQKERKKGLKVERTSARNLKFGDT